VTGARIGFDWSSGQIVLDTQKPVCLWQRRRLMLGLEWDDDGENAVVVAILSTGIYRLRVASQGLCDQDFNNHEMDRRALKKLIEEAGRWAKELGAALVVSDELTRIIGPLSPKKKKKGKK
jgi:hypothetical protein